MVLWKNVFFLATSGARCGSACAPTVMTAVEVCMAFQRGAGQSGAANYGRAIRAAISVLLVGSGAALAQPTPSGVPSFQARIEEVARALQNTPRLKGLTEQERLDRVVVGNTLFVLLHEIGHVHINEMKLPVLGREEDAADTYAALTMLKIGTNFSERVLVEASKGWFLNGRRDQQTNATPLYYDEHDLSLSGCVPDGRRRSGQIQGSRRRDEVA
jgi:hypothetical protein